MYFPLLLAPSVLMTFRHLAGAACKHVYPSEAQQEHLLHSM
jgi:hypothetical protein